MDVDFGPAPGFVLPGCPHVIFHVATAEHAAWVDIFESSKNLFWRALGHLHDHVQPSSVAHAHYEFDRATLARCLDYFVYQRDQRSDSLQRKSLAAEVTLLQDLLK